MAFFSWSRWLRSLVHAQTKPIRNRTSALRLEELETRLAPATDIWSGAGGSINWSTAANWSAGVPKTGDDLVFKASPIQTHSHNDLSAGTAFNSIPLQGDGYLIDGNKIVLGRTKVQGNSGNTTVH